MQESERPDGRGGIDAALVRRLIADQFPQWRDLPVRPVAAEGWDNRTYHLGADMSVRLPSGPGYAAQVEKEHRWLPRLAPQLPLPIPVPLVMGEPAEDYPYRWSVYRWLEGVPAARDRIADPVAFATALGEFLRALYRVDASDGPAAGAHNFFRGGPVRIYDAETQDALTALEGRIDTAHARRVWDAALASTWDRRPVWVHGDVAHGNLLLRDGRLAAVIDFGSSGVGDPACDLVVAWTLLSGVDRKAFRDTLGFDDGTWARARGWALWKALIGLRDRIDADPGGAAEQRHVIDEVLADHTEFG